jgi:hypothetical protein
MSSQIYSIINHKVIIECISKKKKKTGETKNNNCLLKNNGCQN